MVCCRKYTIPGLSKKGCRSVSSIRQDPVLPAEKSIGIDTADTDYAGPDALQQPVGRVGKPEDIAEMILFLCSGKAGFITGENICVDGGMTKLMVYHGDHGWNLEL